MPAIPVAQDDSGFHFQREDGSTFVLTPQEIALFGQDPTTFGLPAPTSPPGGPSSGPVEPVPSAGAGEPAPALEGPAGLPGGVPGTISPPEAPASGPVSPSAPPAEAALEPVPQERLYTSTPQTGIATIDRRLREAGAVGEAGILDVSRGLGRQERAFERYDRAVADRQAVVAKETEVKEQALLRKHEAIEGARTRRQEVQTAIETAVKQEPDPGRWWESRSTFQKVALGIAAFLQGGLKPGEENVVVGMVLDQIDKDVGLQRERINREIDALRERKAEVGQDLDLELAGLDAEYAARLSKFEAADKVLAYAQQRAINDQQRGALQVTRGQLLIEERNYQEGYALKLADLYQQRAELSFHKEQARLKAKPDGIDPTLVLTGEGNAPLRDDQGRPLVARSKDDVKFVNESFDDWRDLNAWMKEYEDLMDEVGPTDFAAAKLGKGPKGQRLRALERSIVTKMGKMSQNGVLSDQDVAFAQEMFPRVNTLTGFGAADEVANTRVRFGESFSSRIGRRVRPDWNGSVTGLTDQLDPSIGDYRKKKTAERAASVQKENDERMRQVYGQTGTELGGDYERVVDSFVDSGIVPEDDVKQAKKDHAEYLASPAAKQAGEGGRLGWQFFLGDRSKAVPSYSEWIGTRRQAKEGLDESVRQEAEKKQRENLGYTGPIY